MLVSTISNPIFARSTDGIEEVARGRGHSTVLMASGYDPEGEAAIAATLAARGKTG